MYNPDIPFPRRFQQRSNCDIIKMSVSCSLIRIGAGAGTWSQQRMTKDKDHLIHKTFSAELNLKSAVLSNEDHIALRPLYSTQYCVDNLQPIL